MEGYLCVLHYFSFFYRCPCLCFSHTRLLLKWHLVSACIISLLLTLSNIASGAESWESILTNFRLSRWRRCIFAWRWEPAVQTWHDSLLEISQLQIPTPIENWLEQEDESLEGAGAQCIFVSLDGSKISPDTPPPNRCQLNWALRCQIRSANIANFSL